MVGQKHLYKSEDGGKTWADITPPLSNDWITFDITVSSHDENTLWISRNSMYGSYPNIMGKKFLNQLMAVITGLI